MSGADDVALIASLRRELVEVRREAADIADENILLRKALKFYLDDDRRAVETGTLESVGARPAYAALGGKPKPCAWHATPSTRCTTCYPSPPRPRVAPAPPRERESRP
jgi:hypothetical protein